MVDTHASNLVLVRDHCQAAHVSSSATLFTPLNIIINVADLENIERILHNPQSSEEGAEANVKQVSPNHGVSLFRVDANMSLNL